jgi:hypothetical protein
VDETEEEAESAQHKYKWACASALDGGEREGERREAVVGVVPAAVAEEEASSSSAAAGGLY